MKTYLLRVGADCTKLGGGFYSRIFEDRSFKFIPIPEKKENLILGKALKYRDFEWRNYSIVPYLPTHLYPRKIWIDNPLDQFIHNDPEFTTFTYGSPIYNKDNPNGSKEKNYRTQLELNTKKGGILAFYAAFSRDGTSIDGYYFFAYFVVDRVIEWNNPDSLSQEDRALVRNNHHFIHKRQNQVVVVGCSDSRVLNKAVLLSSRPTDVRNKNYYPCRSIQEYLGKYKKSLNRSSRRNPSWDGTTFKEYFDLHGS